MPDFFRNGLRSTKAWEVQNSPTLSVVKEDTTSGALGPPALSAWLILSSVMLPTALTVMLGCFFSKAAMFCSMPLTSLGALHPCQKVIVTFALGSSPAPPGVEPVQAVSARADADTATVTVARRRRRVFVVIVVSLITGQVVTGRRAAMRVVSKTSSRASARA